MHNSSKDTTTMHTEITVPSPFLADDIVSVL